MYGFQNSSAPNHYNHSNDNVINFLYYFIFVNVDIDDIALFATLEPALYMFVIFLAHILLRFKRVYYKFTIFQFLNADKLHS